MFFFSEELSGKILQDNLINQMVYCVLNHLTNVCILFSFDYVIYVFLGVLPASTSIVDHCAT
jgi:hypothetical protein